MIRIGIFKGLGRSTKPEPIIIKTEGVEVKPELTSQIASPQQNSSAQNNNH